MRTIFLYIILVGVMLAALLEILRAGENIKAPLDVSGSWKIKNEFIYALDGNCSAVTFLRRKPKLNIEQSGKYLELKLNDSANTIMNGTLENDTLKFSESLPVKKAKDNSCGNNVIVNLTLMFINHNNSPDEIAGSWSTPNCSRCNQISFSAVKENNDQ
ncbi:MAG: hypothetical protein M1480_03485 [Bacteroidetes bacterium]|nr:hypothetical protein [Bacteroidota bacterium]